jgi:hypothetical protein
VPLGGQDAEFLPPAAVAAVLDEFQAALDERWSYRHANGADFHAALASLRNKARGGSSIDELGLELHKILALGIDGHSGVAGYRIPGDRYLPFLIEPAAGRFVAFAADRTALLEAGFPYVLQIDGRDIADWCRAATVLVPKGSPQYIRHRCLGRLRHLDFVRSEMNLPLKDTVDVVLGAAGGTSRKRVTLPAAASSPAYGVWPRGASSVLDVNVGYLRLPNMVRESSIKEIEEWMPRFRDTRGLVVDVRDNDGGERDALRLLYSYFAAPGDPPRVFTAAAYRLHPAHALDHLGGHRMYRADSAKWTQEERRAIERFVGSFKPRWRLPQGQFSDWHYMALTPFGFAQGRPSGGADAYHYDRPVVVLMNGKCFSATDVFLAGLKGMKNVTLLGTASSGGSAHTQEVPLGKTALRLRIGSMVSFQADGRLFDGNGVLPDVVVEPTPEYYAGGADNVLAAALERIGAARRGARGPLRERYRGTPPSTTERSPGAPQVGASHAVKPVLDSRTYQTPVDGR